MARIAVQMPAKHGRPAKAKTKPEAQVNLRYFQYGYFRNGNFYRATMKAESMDAAFAAFQRDFNYDEIVSVVEV